MTVCQWYDEDGDGNYQAQAQSVNQQILQYSGSDPVGPNRDRRSVCWIFAWGPIHCTGTWLHQYQQRSLRLFALWISFLSATLTRLAVLPFRGSTEHCAQTQRNSDRRSSSWRTRCVRRPEMTAIRGLLSVYDVDEWPCGRHVLRIRDHDQCASGTVRTVVQGSELTVTKEREEYARGVLRWYCHSARSSVFISS